MFKVILQKTYEEAVYVEAATESEVREAVEKGDYLEMGDDALVDLVVLNIREIKEKC